MVVAAFVVILLVVLFVCAVLVIGLDVVVDAVLGAVTRWTMPAPKNERERIRREAQEAMHNLRRDSDAEKADAGPLNDKGDLADNEAAALRRGYGLHKGGGTLP